MSVFEGNEIILRENARITDLESSEDISLASDNESTSESETDISWEVPQKASSFVWKIFKLDPARKGHAICRFQYADGSFCNTALCYSKGGSTGPLGVHANKHKKGHLTAAKTKDIPAFFTSVTKKLQDFHYMLLLVRNNRPFYSAKDEGWEDFLFVLKAGYKIPSEPTLSKYRDYAYCLIKEETAKKINEDSLSYAITMDAWSKYHNYVGVVLHNLTKKWVFETYVLNIHCSGAISETHEYLCSLFKKSTKSLKPQKKTGVTVDGGSNFVKMTRENPNIAEFRCTSHLMQNCIISSFAKDSYSNSIRTKCRQIVAYFHGAKKAYASFAIHQAVVGTSPKKFVLQNDTRWYSDYMMLSSVLEQIPALKVFNEINFDLSDNEVEDLKELVDVLGNIRNKFQSMERSTEPTLSRVFPTLERLGVLIDNCLDDPDTRLFFLWRHLEDELSSKFGKLLDNPYYDAATFLDIRFKKLSKLDPFVALCKYLLPENTAHVVTEVNEDSGRPLKKIVDTLLEEISSAVENKETNLDAEIHDYMTKVDADPHQDPLLFWKNKSSKKRYPLLSQVASIVLCIPATSASSERLFSDGGNMVQPHSNGFLPATVEKNLTIKKNWPNLESTLKPKLKIPQAVHSIASSLL